MKTLVAILIVVLLSSNLANAGNEKESKSESTLKGATEVIQPFGGLSWEDGFVEIINKLNAMGVDDIQFNKFSVKGIQDKDELSKVIAKACRIGNDETSFFSWNELYTPDTKEHYLDADGNKVVFFNKCQNPQAITAWPIMISGVPFVINLSLETGNGFAIQYPQKVFILKNGVQQLAIPFFITHVGLSTSSSLYPDKRREIEKIVTSKYGKFGKSEFNLENPAWGLGSAEDINGTRFRIMLESAHVDISYDSEHYSRKFQEVYRKYRADAVSKALKNKQDMGGGL